MSDTAIVPLSSDQWEATRTRAETIIRARLQRPDRSRFVMRDAKYPPVIAAFAIALLIVVALAAFVISAGKQIAAFDVISARLAADYAGRISAGYVNAVLIAALALSEFGVILFGLGAK